MASTNNNIPKKIYDIHCPSCGAAATFDILKQRYECGYCGGKVGISEAIAQKQGFRKIQAEKLQNSMKSYKLFHATCKGCGADIVFEENEALSTCAFCGQSLVRGEYLSGKNIPESVIPFAIKEKEAKELLLDWCDKNKTKSEAKKLRKNIDELKGFYLPYELIRGPVHMSVARMDGFRHYHCEGFVKDEFVSRMDKLDNLLLDGMEPYDIESLQAFDFGYLAGQRVRIGDLSDAAVLDRANQESAVTYAPYVDKVLETKAVEIEADTSDAIRLPVLLPVYYIRKDELMAAVNGQTGKVSIRALKPSHYYFLPWWLKGIVSALVICLILFGSLMLFGMNMGSSLMLTLMTGFVYLIVTLCLYSDTVHNRFRVETERKIYTSGENSFIRKDGKLVLSDEILMRRSEEPLFFEKIEGEMRPVTLSFSSPYRIVSMIAKALIALFLPVIIALFIRGFDLSKINLSGSAVWFCIMVPVVPIYLLKFGIVDLHENPWIYIDKDGKKKRYKRKKEFKITWYDVKTVLKALFIPPVSIGVWFAIISFFVIIYLTAGFE
ncbi:MAG: hypothetical protein IJI46_01185 [Erysipelotrichaceae bacterium]|nr:hypothetical protein [Erysipelotrichaceae bacterium]